MTGHLTKLGAAAASIIAIVGVGALVVSSVTWKVQADESHKSGAAAKQELFSVKELVVLLGNKEAIRSAREEQAILVEAKATEQRESAERAVAMQAKAESAVFARLCLAGVLEGEHCQ